MIQLDASWLVGLFVAAITAMWGTLIAGGKAVFDWMREERREWRTTIEAHTEESTEISRDLRQLLEKEDQEMRLLKELTDEVRRRNGKE